MIRMLFGVGLGVVTYFVIRARYRRGVAVMQANLAEAVQEALVEEELAPNPSALGDVRIIGHCPHVTATQVASAVIAVTGGKMRVCSKCLQASTEMAAALNKVFAERGVL
jgi:hypothetical protein